MATIIEELRDIELFNKYSEDEKKLRTFLSLFYKDNHTIDDIIIDLKFSLENKSTLHIIDEHIDFSKINESLFELYKIKYRETFLKLNMELNNYKQNTFQSFRMN